ncbi:hypothetical protein JOQ06_005726, partial [Pogonophryne albipinna]
SVLLGIPAHSSPSPTELCEAAPHRGPARGGGQTGLLPMTTGFDIKLQHDHDETSPPTDTPCCNVFTWESWSGYPPESPHTPLQWGHAGVRLPVPRKVIQESSRIEAFTALNCGAGRRSVNAGPLTTLRPLMGQPTPAPPSLMEVFGCVVMGDGLLHLPPLSLAHLHHALSGGPPPPPTLLDPLHNSDNPCPLLHT